MKKKTREGLPLIDESNIQDLVHMRLNGRTPTDADKDLKKRKNLPDEIAKRKAKKK